MRNLDRLQCERACELIQAEKLALWARLTIHGNALTYIMRTLPKIGAPISTWAY
jgi:hypothetical protein